MASAHIWKSKSSSIFCLKRFQPPCPRGVPLRLRCGIFLWGTGSIRCLLLMQFHLALLIKLSPDIRFDFSSSWLLNPFFFLVLVKMKSWFSKPQLRLVYTSLGTSLFPGGWTPSFASTCCLFQRQQPQVSIVAFFSPSNSPVRGVLSCVQYSPNPSVRRDTRTGGKIPVS